jgi:hypothetical protein
MWGEDEERRDGMTPEERKRQEDRARERHHINSYAPLEALEKIARENIPELTERVLMNGLDTMGNDAEDFFETSVWSIKEALVEAYLLGKKDAEASLQMQVYKMTGMIRKDAEHD